MAELSPETIPVRVRSRRTEAEGIVTFELEADDADHPLPDFSPGSHIDIHVPGGPVRQYSLCSRLSEQKTYLIAVQREPKSRGGSTGLHDRVEEESRFVISSPRNHFPLIDGASRSILFAGGIGITPIIAMADELDLGRMPFELHYCTRTKARTAFLTRLQQSRYADHVYFHYDDGPLDNRLDLRTVLTCSQPDTHLYVCGPKSFMDAVRAGAADRGWDADHVHFEYFAGAEAHAVTDRSFELVLKRSKRTVRVNAEETCTEALARVGIHVATSCEQGVCGTCLTTVLEGEVDHKDLYLSLSEQSRNDCFLPCCSRSKTRQLVIDL